jgi:NadR type nicotinamide-nucleotide adenylyltransferase
LADIVEVDICTQPGEPFNEGRVAAIKAATASLGNVQIRNLHKTIEQDPKAPGFWEMWTGYLKSWGFRDGDLIVSSETYGNELARRLHGKHMPYDPYREILDVKATRVRIDTRRNFEDILPEFQRYLRPTVTIFGCESTGKTTLTRALAHSLDGHFLMEYARPYLETVSTEITDESMTDIWQGQLALQRSARYLVDKPYVFQDTDLFSTVGYWNFWSPNTMPPKIVQDAQAHKSDLYLITQSNIPFEQDPIRYGGDQRESDDQYWIDLADSMGLNYKVLTGQTVVGRLHEARQHLNDLWNKKVVEPFTYERKANAN